MGKQLKWHIPSLLAIFILIALTSISFAEEGQLNAANLALGKTATASSIYTPSAGYEADKVNDGLMSTRWNSERGQYDNEWVEIDLGANTAFNKVAIKENAKLQRVSAFKVEISTDHTNWTEIASGTALGPDAVFDFTTVNARYVRLFVLSASNCPTIDEFEIYKD